MTPIHKIVLKADERKQVVKLPQKAEVFSVIEQYGDIAMYYKDDGSEKVDRTFYIIETGKTVEPHLRFVATVAFFKAVYVVHVFEAA